MKLHWHEEQSRITETIPVCHPLLPPIDKIVPYFARIDQARMYANGGPLVLALAERLSSRCDLHDVVAVAASGTTALVGAILATAGRGSAERPLCLVPAYTFIGTLSAIELCNYTPHVVDVDPETWMLDADRCARHPLLARVGLVLPVAAYGRSVPQAEWQSFCDKTAIPVVIDGAAALEKLMLAPTIHLGEIPVAVSFHATKVFGTAEGGAVFCANADTIAAARQALNFGYATDRTVQRAALNGKMSEYSAAIGLAELDGWAGKLQAFQQVAQHYHQAAAAIGDAHRFHLSPLIASNYAIFEATDWLHSVAVQAALAEAGVGHRLWYGPGLHQQPYSSKFGSDDVPHAERLAERLIGIPMSVDISPEAVELVVSACVRPMRRPAKSKSRLRPDEGLWRQL